MSLNRLLALGAACAAALSVLVGLLFTPIPAQLGFYQWLVSMNPQWDGLNRACHRGVEWGYTFDELHAVDLTGQTALVTGANSGIGYESAFALSRLGASVTLACRNSRKCEDAAAKIRSDSGAVWGKVGVMIVDVSSLKSVKAFAQRYLEANEKLDMLFLNAGIGSAGIDDDGNFPLSDDGVEMIFATNVLGHHLLYKLLEPALKKSSLSRVVLTSSAASFDPYDYDGQGVATDLKTLNGAYASPLSSVKVYGSSKLAQIFLAKEMARRLGPNVYVNSFHPGMVDTPIIDKNPLIPKLWISFFNYFREDLSWNATEGALTMLYLGVATEELVKKDIRGKYYHPQAREIVNPLSLNDNLQRKLWDFCESLVEDYVEN